jgi:hypothetical protein
METNLSKLDRVLRVILAGGILISISLVPAIGSLFGTILIVIAGVLVVSSIAGFCLVYALLDFKTAK